jgi:hypothetical protein
MAGEQKKTAGDAIDQAVSNLDAAALFGNVIPDIV